MFDKTQEAIDKIILFCDSVGKIFDGTYWHEFITWLPEFIDKLGFTVGLVGLTLLILLKVLGYDGAKKWIAFVIMFFLLTLIL